MSNQTEGPMDQAELRLAAEAIYAIHDAGELDELKAEIADVAHEHDCPPSVEGLLCHRSINQKWSVEWLAGELSEMLGAPREACLQAAASVVLKTRRQIAIDCIVHRAQQLARHTEVRQ